jgi:hypothetical protein
MTGGGPNVHLFVHCVAPLLRRADVARVVTCGDWYPERALPLAEARDVVVLGEPVDPDYLTYLGALGLGPAPERVLVAPPGPAQAPSLCDRLLGDPHCRAQIDRLLGGEPEILLDPYYFGEREAALVRALERRLGRRVRSLGGDWKAIEAADHKDQIRAAARELSIAVADGEVVDPRPSADAGPGAALERVIGKYLPVTGQVIVRGARGTLGSATWFVEDDAASIRRALRSIGENCDSERFLVEVAHDVVVSPNVGLYIDPIGGRAHCTGVTDQCLDSGRYRGSSHPSRATRVAEMVADAHRLAGWLERRGVSGHIGLDFCEVRDPRSGEIRYFLAELNPRVNGATYAQGIFDRLDQRRSAGGAPPFRAYHALNVSTSAGSFARLQQLLGPLRLGPGDAHAVVPYAVGFLQRGHCWLLLLGDSSETVEELRTAVENLLSH